MIAIGVYINMTHVKTFKEYYETFKVPPYDALDNQVNTYAEENNLTITAISYGKTDSSIAAHVVFSKSTKADLVEEESEENWTKIPNGPVVTRITKCLEDTANSNLKLDFVASVEDQSHYIICCNGGKNGSGNWNEYLVDLFYVVNKLQDKDHGGFEKAWLLSLKNDPADDLFIVYLAAR